MHIKAVSKRKVTAFPNIFYFFFVEGNMVFPGKGYIKFMWKVKEETEGELNRLYISSLKREKLVSVILLPKAASCF